jgi:hypothetical protein
MIQGSHKLKYLAQPEQLLALGLERCFSKYEAFYQKVRSFVGVNQ